MPTLSALATVFALLMALAYALRWRYRTWFLLLLASLGLAAAGQHWLAGQGPRAAAPAQGLAEAQRLRALSWPGSLAEQARLAPSFQGVEALQEAQALAFVYRVAVLQAMVGDAPFAFATVADALAWRAALGSHGSPAHRKPWQALGDLSDRALATLISVRFPEGEPTLSPKGGGSADNVLRFPILVTHTGQGKITDAQVSLAAYLPTEGALAPTTRPLKQERFACWVLLRDLLPGESRLLTCELGTLHAASPGTQRLMADVALLRAGKLALWPGLTVALDYEPLTAPNAAPLNPEQVRRHAELKAADAQAAQQAARWRQALQAWLAMGGVALLGFAVPGARGHAVPLCGVLAQGLAVGGLALAGVWFYMARQGAMTGYAPLVVLLIAGLADGLFIGGVLLGNVVRGREGERVAKQLASPRTGL
jgi:hypothetical protein